MPHTNAPGLNPLFGRSIGINMDKNTLSDSTFDVLEVAVIYAGRPVALDSNSKLNGYGNDATTGGAGNVKVFGLARANKNQFVNEAGGSDGFFGSGQLDVAIMGIAHLSSNVFTQTTTTVDIEKPTFDTALTFAVNEALYVNQSADADKRGLITNVLVTSGGDANDNTFVGFVLAAPTSLDTSLKILLLPKTA